MFTFFRSTSVVPSSSFFGNSLLMNGLLCVLFGIAILSAPELLAYIVATFLIVIGVSLLSAWYRMKSLHKRGWYK